jgi:integrase
MKERSEGNVLERPSAKGSKIFALRFQAYGRRHYITLGSPEEGWTRRLADEELEVIRAQVGRGVWVAPPPRRRGRPGGGPGMVAIFGQFARERIDERREEVKPSMSDYRRWGLAHLNPYFSDWCLSDIDARAVDEYRLHKVKESNARRRALEEGRPRRNGSGQPLRPLAASSINKTIDTLHWLLSFACEYGCIDGDNPAAGKRRRLKVDRPDSSYLKSAAQIEALLEAATRLDHDPRWQLDERLAIIATLIFAGLRANEFADLRWGDLDFTTSRIQVRHSKTPAGNREIVLLPVLRRHLLAHRDDLGNPRSAELVFRTERGSARNKDNLRARILGPALIRADRLLEAGGHPTLPSRISPHSLRHTFASLLFAIGEDPVSVMYQLGHTDPAFTLRVYAHVMRRDPRDRERLRAIVGGGTNGPDDGTYRGEWTIPDRTTNHMVPVQAAVR